jgi:hypothetical protein
MQHWDKCVLTVSLRDIRRTIAEDIELLPEDAAPGLQRHRFSGFQTRTLWTRCSILTVPSKIIVLRFTDNAVGKHPAAGALGLRPGFGKIAPSCTPRPAHHSPQPRETIPIVRRRKG